ncbi:DUF6549 family protein [Segatella maculosa]|jgi:signal transduction histidine kinase|uniref:DUF6549 family protein n=1 Tax=Segatella maculosa TaxID=439703 RepID=UPI0023F4C336|nr:DUF6549 family protein [Segatella maculosa]
MKFKTFSALLMLLFAGLAFFAVRSCISIKVDRDRLCNNQNLLLHNGNVEISETASGRSRASVPALNIRPSEFRRSGDALLKVAKSAGIKSSRISDAATAATVTRADIVANLSSIQADDSASNLSTRLPVNSSTRLLAWSDPWLSISGTISDSLIRCSVSVSDTLDIIVHRVPRRFLFFRFGCREVRMDIISRNPHTRLTYARYYKLVK